MFLKKVVERTKVEKSGSGARFINEGGHEEMLRGDEVVSMNLWGFRPSIFDHIQGQFAQFLKEHGNDNKAELYIPSVVDNLIHSKKVQVKVLPTDDCWFGVTYREDKAIAQAAIKELIEAGVYPQKLWR